jgi:hypothetical protein
LLTRPRIGIVQRIESALAMLFDKEPHGLNRSNQVTTIRTGCRTRSRDLQISQPPVPPVIFSCFVMNARLVLQLRGSVIAQKRVNETGRPLASFFGLWVLTQPHARQSIQRRISGLLSGYGAVLPE